MSGRASVNYLEGDVYYAYIFDYKDKFDRWSMAMALQGDQVGHAKKIGLKIKQSEDKFEGLREKNDKGTKFMLKWGQRSPRKSKELATSTNMYLRLKESVNS